MPREQTSDYTIYNYSGGINEAIDESQIKKNEAKSAQNCDIDYGVLSRVNGISKYSDTLNGIAIGTLMPLYKDDTLTLLVAHGDKLSKFVNNTLTQLATGMQSDNYDFICCDIHNTLTDSEVIIFTNGLDPVKVFDGTTIRDLKHGALRLKEGSTIEYEWYDDGTLAPKGNAIDLHYERVWLTDNKKVYFSAATRDGFNPDDWTAPIMEGEANQHGGEIDLPTFDGGTVIGLKVIFDDVLIFKTSTIFKIFGTYPGNYEKVQLYSSNGAIADKSIVTINNKAFFIDTDGIKMYDGVNIHSVSDRVKDTWNSLNAAYLKNAVATKYKNKYVIAVPEGSSTENNLIIEYNTDLNTYMLIRGLSVKSFVNINDIVLLTTAQGVFKYNSGDTFNGSIINSYYETGYTDMGYTNAIKNITGASFVAKGNGSIKITCITERKPKEKIIVLTNIDKPYTINLNNYGRILKFRIENINGSYFTVKGLRFTLDMDFD